MTVGAPGSGKTTWANTLDRSEWLVLCLDDFRDCLFGAKSFFWTNVVPKHGMDARRYVRRVYNYALRDALTDNLFNIALVNTSVYEDDVKNTLAKLGAHAERLELRVFDVSAEVLWQRNAERTSADKLFDKDLAGYITAFHDPNAWWRKKHRFKMEIVK